jgi:hypothetical protein
LDWRVEDYFNTPTNSSPLPEFLAVEKLTVNYSCCDEDCDNKQHPARFQTDRLSLLPQLQELVIKEHYGVGPYVSLSGITNLMKLAVVKLIKCELDNTNATTTNTTLQLFSTLRELRTISCSDRVKFLEFDLPDIEIIDLDIDTENLNFGFDKSSQIKGDDAKRYFHLHDIGICPNLIEFLIALTSFPSVQEVSLRKRKFEFVNAHPLSLSIQHQGHPEQVFSLPTFRKYHSERV